MKLLRRSFLAVALLSTSFQASAISIYEYGKTLMAIFPDKDAFLQLTNAGPKKVLL